MGKSSVEVAIVGGGAAGIAAAHRLTKAGVDCMIIEARDRLGGRAWTVPDAEGHALDMGCGWLHSADRNPWTGIATAQGRLFNKAPPPWENLAMTESMPEAEQMSFSRAMAEVYARMAQAAITGIDTAASDYLEPGNRWNPLINTLATFISGVEFDRMSAIDFDRYNDSDINWRLFDGYGALVASHGEGVAASLNSEVTRIDHSGKRIRIETAQGAIEADRVIVTLPTTVLARHPELFAPLLPAKTDIAHRLPLGYDDKLFITLDHAEEFDVDARVFGHSDRSNTGSYNFRPFGRPMIEAFYGGRCAEQLEDMGEAAFFDFALAELTGLFGHDFARRIKPIIVHRWGADPFAGGAYSYAVPGAADERAVLAEPVDERLFFAGEACSRHDFSTAHGAYITGIEAADRIIAARR